MRTRPTLIDVTLRDGGLANGFKFGMLECTDLTRNLGKAGLDYVEVGYFRPRPGDRMVGPIRCDRDYLSLLGALPGSAKLAVMVHVDEVEASAYDTLFECGVRLVRLPVTEKISKQMPEHLGRLRELGIPFTINIIRVSELADIEIERFAGLAADQGAAAIYVADSNGSLTPGETHRIVSRVRKVAGLETGFHAHDNLSLAFANGLAALDAGATWLDCSLGGLGKGGCNLQTELLALHLRSRDLGEFDVFLLDSLYRRWIERWMRLKHRERFVNAVLGTVDANMDVARVLSEIEDVGTRNGRLADLLDERVVRTNQLAGAA